MWDSRVEKNKINCFYIGGKMKKFIVYLLVIVLTVSLSFAVFYLVRNDEVITISTSSMYVDKGDPFTIDITDQNRKEYTDVTINISNEDVVKYDETKKEFIALTGGVSRINFKTNNVKFRNLSCDVIVGDGTITSPFYISNAEQLASIGMGEQLKDENDNLLNAYAGKAPYTKYSSDKYYKLINNIDVSSINDGYWIPLRPFSGSLDGNGLTISKVAIDIDNHKKVNDGKSGLFGIENVGFFSEILPNGIVYNLKFNNFGATGKYTNFGCVAGVNKGTIERVEIKDTFLSVESDVFGGITAINTSRETGENDTYNRDIARIECSNVNLFLGKKYASNSTELVPYGVTGVVGGLVGINNAGTVAYSYSTGDIYFGADNDEDNITYGGLVGVNNSIQMEKIGGMYTQLYQGGNIKDSYSSICTYLKKAPHSTSSFGGVIGKNTDVTLGKYDDNENIDRVANYLSGVRYDRESLNLDNKITEYTKDFNGVAINLIDDVAKTFVEKDTTICRLNGSELKNKKNFVSYKTQVDEEGKPLEQSKNVLWAFGTIWGMDDKINKGMPYLNYTVVTIADDFRNVGIPVMDSDVYTFTFDTSQPIVIVSGQNGYLELKLNETYNLSVSPYEAMKDITWSSSDPAIVSVDNDGKITALDGGIVTITAESKSGFVDSIKVRVIVDDVYFVENIPSEINLYVGETYQFKDYKIYVNGNVIANKGLSYYPASNEVSVTANGKVTANTPGSTTIDVSIGNFSKSVDVNVYSKEDPANKVVEVKFKETNFSYTYTGTQINGNIVITSAICDSTDIKDTLTFGFETENEMVEVNYNSKTSVADGISIPFKVKGAGRCVITCVVKSEGYYSNATDIIIISELEKQDEQLLLDTYSVKLLEGVSKQLVASGFSNRTVSWKSANNAIATVDKYGLITAISEGSTTITATITLNDGTRLVKTCNVTVVGEEKYINYSAALNGNNLGKNLVIYEIYQNESITIKAESNYKFGANEKFGWNIAKDSHVEVVSKTGTNDNTITLKGLNIGKVPVTINAGGKTSVTLYVKVLKTVTPSTPDDGGEDVTPPTTPTPPTRPTIPAYNKFITNINELNAVRYHLDKDFELLKSIDLSGIDWEPIAWKEGEYFTGSFTAYNSSVISNMTISDVDKFNGYHALFGKVKNATIENVRIDNAKIVSNKYSAGLVTVTYGNTSINNCSANNSSFHASNNTFTVNMGAILGISVGNTTITNCISNNNTFTVASNTNSQIGGIVGNFSVGTIERCRVRGTTISGNTKYQANPILASSGGIVGVNIIDSKIIECTVGTSTIVGYNAGGIIGYLNDYDKIIVEFKEYSKGYRKEDISTLSNLDYFASISKCGVDSHTTVKGAMVGGLVGITVSGVILNSYTRATLEGVNSSSILGGFTAELRSDANFGRRGGDGTVGVIDTCYSACNFKGNGKWYSATSSENVHKYNTFGGDDVARNAGFMFNYLVEKKLGAKDLSCSGIKNYVKDSYKSESEMKDKQTYIDKGFSSTTWLFGTAYPMLNELNTTMYN